MNAHKQDRAVRRILRDAEIPVPADDDMTDSPVVWIAGAIVFVAGMVVGAAAATFFGG